MSSSVQCAQTNIQLFKQLIIAGYPLSDIELVRGTYDLAADLSSGQFRGCGKPFIAHLVGAASVQALLGRPVAEIQAALLHSVYTFGDFGGVARGCTENKRDRVRALVGQEVEALVYGFHRLKWDEQVIGKLLHDDPSGYSDVERATILMRLAHEIEEHADWSFLFDNKFDKSEVLRRVTATGKIAERMNETRLAEYARDLLADVQRADPAMHAGTRRSGRVYLIVPNSCRLRHTGKRIYRTLTSGLSRRFAAVRKTAARA